MGDSNFLAQSYLSPAAHSCWRWGHNLDAIEWSDGKTIAMAQEVQEVLRHLAPFGFPPFDAIVLVLAACRDNWPNMTDGIAMIIGMTHHAADEPKTLQWVNESVTIVTEGLNCIHALPAEQRTAVEYKALIAELVFEALPSNWVALAPPQAADVVKELDEGLYNIFPHDPPLVTDAEDRDDDADSHLSSFIRGTAAEPGAALALLKVLRHGIGRISAERLAMRRRTGLDEPVKTADLELPPVDRVRGLLEVLRNDTELAGLARLSRDLMAAMHIPRPMSARHELPVGGFSDISNRGPLDRLLTSELAHDEFTLAVRVALNEALYLHREMPPETPQGRRAILIDVGIRMWGVPRVFATAVALALAATAERHTELLVFRAHGNKIEPVDLTTREGLVEHLSKLEPLPHPGAAVGAFLDAVAQGTGPLDRIVVTHHDCLSDARFRKHLPREVEPFHCAAVDRNGDFKLSMLSRQGQSVVREAHLQLDDILVQPKRKLHGVPLVAAEVDPDLPVILSTDPFPLLLPHIIDIHRATHHPEHGVVEATKDGRLLHWRRPDQGALQITDLLPRRKVWWIGIDDHGIARILFAGGKDRKPVLIGADLSSRRCTRIKLQEGILAPQSVGASGGALLICYRRHAIALDIHTGKQGSRFTYPPKVIHWMGRFCLSGEESPPKHCHALAWNGSSICRESVKCPPGCIALIDRQGVDGPWAVLDGGRIVSLASDESFDLRREAAGPFRVYFVSQDGHRLIGESGSGQTLFVDIQKRTTRPTKLTDPHRQLEQAIAEFSGRHTLRKKFESVCTYSNGNLGLLSANRLVVVNWAPAQGGDICISYCDTKDHPIMQESELKPAFSPPAVGYGLKVARLAGGHKVYLDSRSLLHLKSADSSIPETTLVLCDQGPLAGWCSDGTVCGPSYYFHEPDRSDPEAIFSRVREFVKVVH